VGWNWEGFRWGARSLYPSDLSDTLLFSLGAMGQEVQNNTTLGASGVDLCLPISPQPYLLLRLASVSVLPPHPHHTFPGSIGLHPPLPSGTTPTLAKPVFLHLASLLTYRSATRDTAHALTRVLHDSRRLRTILRHRSEPAGTSQTHTRAIYRLVRRILHHYTHAFRSCVYPLLPRPPTTACYHHMDAAFTYRAVSLEVLYHTGSAAPGEIRHASLLPAVPALLPASPLLLWDLSAVHGGVRTAALLACSPPNNAEQRGTVWAPSLYAHTAGGGRCWLGGIIASIELLPYLKHAAAAALARAVATCYMTGSRTTTRACLPPTYTSYALI